MTRDMIFVIAVLAILYAVYAIDKRRKTGNVKSDDRTAGSNTSASDHASGCCGKHTVCEKQKLAEARMHQAQYFDDEELDRFKGRESDSYEDNDVEEFRYVMYTMQKDEVRTWMECIEARGIEFPDQLKEEAWSIMNGQ